VQVVYFPGIDLYTHIADKALHDEVEYFKTLLDASVGQIVDEYRKQGALDRTYVIFISDHGYTPVLKDENHLQQIRCVRHQVVNLSRLQNASSQNQPEC
jgi:predicted AlkP superfamily pyrophosphatase or phosphodiesterase